ncbi:DUF6634 family protein [Pararoseomonas sp. SCSIO 73927]|uniref:DUF6634 family protein n=1 Tax=Pararoseomonas sp. SCSIO 73927 TaxID=3114537 RepID=UPI0030CCC4B1
MIHVHPGREHARLLLLLEADRLAALARDLRAIAEGTAPTASELDSAPVLDRWQFSQRTMTTMVGNLVGHPRLPDGSVHTTEIWAISTTQGWARTLSRYYALGNQRSDGGHAA